LLQDNHSVFFLKDFVLFFQKFYQRPKAYQITLEEYFEEVQCREQKGMRKEEDIDYVSVQCGLGYITDSRWEYVNLLN
jgi:hypothetical protein